MQIRNIHRYFTFDKAVRLHNRQAEHNLTTTDILILSSLHDGYNSLLTIHDHLKRFYKTRALNIVSDTLKAMKAIKYAEQKEKKWVLTLAGRNALTALEKRCRETRYDK